jgi:hypothetical protein
MSKRPRVDLDGIPLVDQENPTTTLVIFRFRTTQGLMMLMPESAEFFIPWASVEAANLDLLSGTFRISLSPEYIQNHNWVRGATTLTGRWIDRVNM